MTVYIVSTYLTPMLVHVDRYSISLCLPGPYLHQQMFFVLLEVYELCNWLTPQENTTLICLKLYSLVILVDQLYLFAIVV